MKIIRLKNNKVIGVWKEEENKIYSKQKHLQDFDDEIKVKDDTEVFVGMEYKNKKFVIPKPQPTEEEIKQKNEQELVKKLGGDNRFNALVKFVNVLAKEFAEKNPDSETAKLLKVVQETLKK